jgi:hypothetical protein
LIPKETDRQDPFLDAASPEIGGSGLRSKARAVCVLA